MASSRSSDLSLVSSTSLPLPLNRGGTTHVAARAGEHYRVVGSGTGQAPAAADAILEDDVIAVRRGEDLHLRYGDLTEVVLDRFFVECARAQCSVELPSSTAPSQILTGDNATGVVGTDGGGLLYAHGEPAMIGALLQQGGYSAPGAPPAGLDVGEHQATYLPPDGGGAGGARGSMGIGATVGLGALTLGALALAVGGGGNGGNGSNGSNGGNGSSGSNGGGGDGLSPSGDGGNGIPLPPDDDKTSVPAQIIEGSVVAGPVIADHGLVVGVYAADGRLLASGVVDSTGHFLVGIAGTYSGPVLVRIQDTTPGADYRDEARATDVDLAIDLRAASLVTGVGAQVQVNMLTELAVRKLGLGGGADGAAVVDLAGVSADDVLAANALVARAFGLTQDLVGGPPPIAIITAAGAANGQANDYGRLLAALSGAEVDSSSADVLALLETSLGASGLSASAISTLVAGAALAATAVASGNPTGLVTDVSNLLGTGASAGSGLAIDAVAGDNVVIRAEARAGFEVSGSAPANATLTVSWGDVSRTVTADASGRWQAAFGGDSPVPADGGSILSVELDGVVITRGVFIDTQAPAAPTQAVTAVMGGNDEPIVLADTAGYSASNRPAFIIGTGLAGTPILYLDGEAVPAHYDPVHGTLTPVDPVDDGAREMTWALADPLGNESEPSPVVAITIDTVAPATPASAPAGGRDGADNLRAEGQSIASDRPAIQVGTDLVGEPALYIDGQRVDATYDSTTGLLTPAVALAEGDHGFSFTLTDAAGNESGRSPALTLTVDTTAPDAPTAAPLGYQDTTGPITSDTSAAPVTDSIRPGFIIGTNLVGQPSLYVDGYKIDATYDAASGRLTPVSGLGDGARLISYTLTDAAGNESGRSPTLTVTIDTEPPATPLPATGYADDVGPDQTGTSSAPLTDDNRPGLVVGTTPAGAPSLYVDGVKVDATWDATRGTLTPTAPLADGQHALTWTVSDAAGNESPASLPLTVTIDTVAPTTVPSRPSGYVDEVGPYKSETSTAAVTDDTRPGIRAGAIELATDERLVLLVDGVAVEASWDAVSGILRPTAALPAGEHQIAVAVRDAAGNTGTASPAMSLTVQTTTPSAPATAPVGYIDDVGSIIGTRGPLDPTDDLRPGLLVGANLGDTPRLYVDGVEVAATYDRIAGTLTPDTDLATGAHTLTYTLSNQHGESGASPAFAVTVATLPAAPSEAPVGYVDDVGRYTTTAVEPSTAQVTDDTRPGFKVEANLVGQPSLYVDGVRVDATYDSTTGLLTPVAALAEGQHQVSWTLSNAVGDGPASPSFEVTIDITAPAAPAAAIVEYFRGSSDSPQLASDAKITDNQPAFVIPNLEGQTAVLLVDGVEVAATASIQSGGKTALRPDAPLMSGDHTVGFAILDEAGNRSDTSPPWAVSVVPPAPTFVDDVPHFMGSGLADNDWFPAYTNDVLPEFQVGTGWTVAPVLYSGNVALATTYDSTTGLLALAAPLAEGQYEISYGVPGSGGSELRSATLDLVVDTTAPLLPADAGPFTSFLGYQDGLYGQYSGGSTSSRSPQMVTEDNLPMGMMFGEDSAYIVVDGEPRRIWGSGWGSGTEGNYYDARLDLAPGTYAIAWGVMDAAGNLSPTTTPFMLTVVEPPLEPSGLGVAPLGVALLGVVDPAAVTDAIRLADLGEHAGLGAVANAIATATADPGAATGVVAGVVELPAASLAASLTQLLEPLSSGGA